MFQAKTTNENSPDLTNLQACKKIELLELKFSYKINIEEVLVGHSDPTPFAKIFVW